MCHICRTREFVFMGTFRDFNTPVFKNLTSAIRALAMDAVQKANSGHPACPWVWQK